MERQGFMATGHNRIGRRVLAGLPLTFGEVTVVEKVHRPKLRLGRHDHDRPYLCWVSSGCYVEEIRGASHGVGPGCMMTNLDGAPHANRFLDTAVRSLVFTLPSPPPGVPGLCFWPASSAAARWAGAIDLELGTSDDLRPAVLSELFAELLTDLIPQGAPGARLPARVPDWLERVRTRLDEDPMGPVKLPALAADAGIHEDHLTRCFRRHFRTTVGQYVRRRRLDWAAATLVACRSSIAEVALEAGFADQSHFTRHFRRRFGLPPSRYRRAFHA